MIAILKRLFCNLGPSFPLIEPVEFADGLLAFRSERALPFAAVTVLADPATKVTAQLKICSYDNSQRIYRAEMVDAAQTLRLLELPARGSVRLAQAVRVSSRQIAKFFALTEDVSLSGIRLATPDVLAVGTVMEMSLDLDDPAVPSISVNGEVRWSAVKADGSYHSGVHFVGIDARQYRILERYINSRLATARNVHGEG